MTPAIACLALASLVLFLALVFEDVAALDLTEVPVGLILRYALAMGLGGALIGRLLLGLFGKSGLLGWCVAFLGGVIVATLAGIVGSAIGLAPDLLADGYQTTDLVAMAAGALVLPLAVIGWPVLILIWLVLVFAAHVLARRAREAA